MISLKLSAAVLAAGMVAALAATPAMAAELFSALKPYCGKAYAGKLLTNAPEDAEMAGKPLVVVIADCRADEVRMPFHVGDDRSRTWVLRQLTVNGQTGVQLKHDHRHQDGSSDALTMYGGFSETTDGLSLQFPADGYSKTMFGALGRQVAQQNVWSFSLVPGQQLTYRLSRPGREFAVGFDLTTPVSLPPAAWGAPLWSRQ